METVTDTFYFVPEAASLLAFQEKPLFQENEEFGTVKVDKLEVAAWGEDNDIPQQILNRVKKSEVVSSNLNFNIGAGYGLAPRPMRRIVENNKVVGYEELIEGEVVEFFEDNDVSLYFLEQLTDINYFGNTFAELILNEGRNKIVSLRSKEAAFSRWTTADAKGRVKHVYSAKWAEKPKKGEYTVSEVLDEYNPFLDLFLRCKKVREPRFIYPVYIPSPSRPYYAEPAWWSIFNSGFYDHSVAVPAIKNAILENKLGIKFIIYISDKYFEEIFRREGIDPNNRKEVSERIALEKRNFTEFLTGAKGKAKSLMAIKKMVASGTGVQEEKYIEIVEVKNDLMGGELITDLEEVNNVICYAMGVHPSLVGAVPGKNKGGFSGSDKRELFLIKQALLKPLIDRVLRPFQLIKKFNGWDKDTVIVVPEWEFTTLDKEKSGKKETIKD
jgi:hypothetical protein